MTDRRTTGKLFEKAFIGLALAAVVLPLLLLAVLIADVIIDSSGRLGLDFLSSYPSRKPEQAGILPGLVGSIYLIMLTAAMALPIGVGAALYLEEYGKKGRLSNLIDRRHARVSTAVTSNIELSAWGRYLGDATVTKAILDRLVSEHHQIRRRHYDSALGTTDGHRLDVHAVASQRLGQRILDGRRGAN